MGLWVATGSITGLSKNTPVTVFNAESLSDGEESIAVALPADAHTKGVDITFQILFGSAPTTVDYLLQVALNNLDASFFDIAGSNMTDTAGGKVTVNGVVARFARIKAVDADTETVTGIIMAG